MSEWAFEIVSSPTEPEMETVGDLHFSLRSPRGADHVTVMVNASTVNIQQGPSEVALSYTQVMTPETRTGLLRQGDAEAKIFESGGKIYRITLRSTKQEVVSDMPVRTSAFFLAELSSEEKERRDAAWSTAASKHQKAREERNLGDVVATTEDVVTQARQWLNLSSWNGEIACVALYLKGEILEGAKRYEEAVGAYSELLELLDTYEVSYPDLSVRAEINRAMSLSLLGRHDEAMQAYAAIENAHGNASDGLSIETVALAIHNMANTHRLLGDVAAMKIESTRLVERYEASNLTRVRELVATAKQWLQSE